METLDEPIPAIISGTRTDGRRRRLRRGIDRWYQDLRLAPVDVRGVALITFTLKDADPGAARGQMRALWQRFRLTYGAHAYFCWLEVQRRGAPHYHALVVNPPWKTAADFYRWSNPRWAGGWQRRSYERRSAQWLFEDGGRYVKKYAKKESPGRFDVRGGVDRGHYQQNYEDIPRELRTFMCQRLGHSGAELDAHRNRLVWDYVGDINWPWHRRRHHWWSVSKSVHHEGPDGCSLRLTKRRRPLEETRRRARRGRRMHRPTRVRLG